MPVMEAFDALVDRAMSSRAGVEADPAASKIIDRLKREGVTVTVGDDGDFFTTQGGKVIDQYGKDRVIKGRWVNVRPNSHVATLAHEAGHATGKPLTQKVVDLTYGPSHRLSHGLLQVPVSLLLLNKADKAYSSKELTDAEKLEELDKAKKGAFVLGALQAPMLAEEARASVRGTAMLTKLKGLKGGAAGAARMAVAYSTYLAGLIPAAATAAYAEHMKRRIEKTMKGTPE